MANDKVFGYIGDVAEELISSDKKVHLIYALMLQGKQEYLQF